MNIGDLVIMPKAKWPPTMGAVGIVVETPVNKGKQHTDARVAVQWSGSEGVYMEPCHWLEVISEKG